MKDRDREQSAPSKSPSGDRSIPRGTDEHARDDADEMVKPASDDDAAKRARDRKTDASPS